MASKQEIRALITLAGKIDPSLQTALLKASGESMKLSKNLEKSANGLNRVATIAKGTFLGGLAANAVSSLTSRIWEFGKESIKLASDLNEVQNVVDTTFGNSAKQINSWSKTALTGFGLSRLQAKQFAGTMGAMLKSSGVANKDMVLMSQNLAGLSGDFASFYNLSQQETFEKIRSGISGETEPLKQLGINMSVANLEAFALSKGIKTSYNQMDQATQTLLRYNYLMEVSKDAQGDFAKTHEGFANQNRLFNTTLQELSATIASKALPHLTKFFQKANEYASNVDIDKAASKAAVAFNLMGNSIKWVGDNSNWLIPVAAGLLTTMAGFKALALYTSLMDKWQKATKGMTIAQWALNVAMNANPIGLIIVGIGLAVAAGVALWRNWDKVKAKALELWSSLVKLLGPIGKLFGLGKKDVDLKVKVSKEEKSPTQKPLRKYASGGIASEPSIFGEAGDEMAIPLRRTPRSLGLLAQAQQIIGGASGGSVQLTYAPTIYGANRAEIEPVLRRHKEEIRAMLEEMFADKERVAYGY